MFAQPAYHRSVYLSIVLLIILQAVLTACGGDEAPTSIPSPSPKLPPTVKLTVSTVNVQEGKEAAILIDIQPYEKLDWTWEISGSSGGILSSDKGETVVYTAGKAGIDTVTARAQLSDGTSLKQSVTINVDPAATEVPPPTETPLPPKVTLDGIQDNQKMPCSNLISGTYPAELDKAIWPIVFIGGVYHPQDEGGKAAQMANGKWFQTVRFGDCVNSPNKDIGLPFQLIVVTANESANAAFEAYIANGKKSGQWPGMSELPSGTEEQSRVIVIRE